MRALLALLPLILTACGLSVPVALELTPYLPPEAASGSHTLPFPAPGSYPAQLEAPTPQGAPVDLSSAQIPGRLESGSLEADLEVRVSGDASPAGQLALQLYLAPEGADLWDAAYALGAPAYIDLAQTQPQTLTVRGALSPAQLEALNARRFRVGLRLEGVAQVQAGGTATLAWQVARAALEGRPAVPTPGRAPQLKGLC